MNMKLAAGPMAMAPESISLTLWVHSEQAHYPLQAPAEQSVGSLLQELLSQLEQGDNGERFAQLRECYEPVLERLNGGEGITLENHHSLLDAGLRDGDQLQIAARPRKEKLLFCRYSELG